MIRIVIDFANTTVISHDSMYPKTASRIFKPKIRTVGATCKLGPDARYVR